MKLFKNIVRLLVLTSLSLSFTPLTTTKAVSSTPIQVENPTKLGISLQSNAEALSASTTNDTATTATSTDPKNPTSTVSVTVLSGILTLEAVPDFNFGTMTVGSIGKLKSNTVSSDDLKDFVVDDGTNTATATAGIDGNSAGTLAVIDSRNNLKTMPGFTLSASMGNLKTSDANDAGLNAILHLSAMPLLNQDNENVSSSGTDLKTEKVSIASGSTETKNVMNLKAGSYNGGLIKATFNTPDSASLEIPNQGDNTNTTASAKRRNAVVTWTLNAAPAATN